jgi:oligosaccharide translocation protein RFT1
LAEYSLVGSLVGLVARFLFQPAEEAAFNTFSNKEGVLDSSRNWALLRRWLGAMLAIGLCAIIFSQTCGKQFLKIVYSDKWATDSADQMLKAYCIYCFFMAMNGTTEAFVFATGN